MTDEEPALRGRVAKLITDEELVINIGSVDGVKSGMLFDVLDQATEDIVDPVTYKKLGSVDRVKSRVRVTTVGERIALAHVTAARGNFLSSAAQVMTGQPAQSAVGLSGDAWPDGVRVRDPVRLVIPVSFKESSAPEDS
jgi:hypothetical protein